MKKKKAVKRILKALYYIALALCSFIIFGTVLTVVPFVSDLASMAFLPAYPYVLVASLALCGIALFWFLKEKSRRNVITFIVAATGVLAVVVMSAVILISVNKQGENISLFKTFVPTSVSDVYEDSMTYTDQKDDQIPVSFFYKKDGKKNKPVIFYTHGGGWVQGSRYDRLDTTKTFAENGYVVMCPEYDLSDDEEHLYNFTELQLVEALRFCLEQVAAYGGDRTQLYLVGDSAGGNLALELAYKINSGLYTVEDKVKAVSVIYPVTDIQDFYNNKNLLTSNASKQMAVSYMGALPEEESERYKAFNPANYIGSKTPPTLLVLGTSDSSVPPASTYRFYEALQSKNVPAKLIKVPFANHVGDKPVNTFLGQAYVNNTLRWFEQNK